MYESKLAYEVLVKAKKYWTEKNALFSLPFRKACYGELTVPLRPAVAF